MKFYCMGIRLDSNYMEKTCKNREYCPYYHVDGLSDFLSRPDEYQELDTYNNNQCEYENINA